MKKILLAATAALAITSCSQNEEFENPNQQTKIDFTSIVKKATRAADTTTDNFLAFTVSSYVTTAGYDGTSSLGTAYMNGISYTRANAATGWSTTDTGIYYWPSISSEKKVQFFAYPTTNPTSYTLPTTGYPSISFTVDNDPASQKDLVVAHAADVTSATQGVTDGKLTLDFKHVLTRINFAFTPEDQSLTYKVTDISIANVKGGTGVYSFNATNGEWNLDNATDVSSYAYDVKQSADKVTDKNYYSLANTNASWMLFPQKVNGKVISITYSTAQNGMEVFSGTKEVTLPTDAEWKLGQNVLYVLTLPAGASQVGIDANVSDWNTTSEDLETAK